MTSLESVGDAVYSRGNSARTRFKSCPMNAASRLQLRSTHSNGNALWKEFITL